jgi:hypothetical protein
MADTRVYSPRVPNTVSNWLFHPDYYEANKSMPRSIQLEVSQKLDRHGIPVEDQKELSETIAEMLDLHRGYYEQRRNRNIQRARDKKNKQQQPEPERGDAPPAPTPMPPPKLNHKDRFTNWLHQEATSRRGFT